MVCLYCSGETSVVNSRKQRKNNHIWRRRRCLDCSALFTSVETPVLSSAWRVQGRNGNFKPFSRDKLLISILNSCRHRKEPLKDAMGLTSTTINKIGPHIRLATIKTTLIAKLTAEGLKHFDKAAFVQYQAYHP